MEVPPVCSIANFIRAGRYLDPGHRVSSVEMEDSSG